MSIADSNYKSDSRALFFGSGVVQERSKRLPRGFLTPSASRSRFGRHFGFRFRREGEAWDLKNQRILLDVLKVLGFGAFRLAPPLELDFELSRAPFWDPFGPYDR